MSEIIVTLEDIRGEPSFRINPWIYDLSGKKSGPFLSYIKVLPGMSPIRETLLATQEFPEQELSAWERIPLQRIRIGDGAAPPVLEPARDVDTTTREKTISHFMQALQKESGSLIEHYPTDFGCVVVAALNEPYYLAFGLGAGWPIAVLEVHRLNRNIGTTECLSIPEGLTAFDIPRLIDIFRGAAAIARRTADVDG